MPEVIKAIQTTYAGRRFRSRLEARWAVAFDILKIEWEYETEGFDIGLGRGYLPDFKLGHYWAEVKPVAFSETEREKAEKIVEHTGQPLLMLVGPLDYRAYEMLWWEEYDGIGKVASRTTLLPSDLHAGRYWWEPHPHEIEELKGCPRYTSAVSGARGARFEFGESGAAA